RCACRAARRGTSVIDVTRPPADAVELTTERRGIRESQLGRSSRRFLRGTSARHFAHRTCFIPGNVTRTLQPALAPLALTICKLPGTWLRDGHVHAMTKLSSESVVTRTAPLMEQTV